jgi:penicillin-binding protein 1A
VSGRSLTKGNGVESVFNETLTGNEPVRPPDTERVRRRALFARLRVSRRLAALLKIARRRRTALLIVSLVPLAMLLGVAGWLIHHVYFDRDDLPDLDAFVRFEPATTGVVRDQHGAALIELAREYRQVVTYDEVPLILRQAILAAEDKSFFTHSGVDYHALPRVVQKTAKRSLSEWWKSGQRLRLLLPQGGSTLTQQLVRGYFLQGLTSRSNDDPLFHTGLTGPRLFSLLVGAPAANKLLRKLEEVRLTLWLEREMCRRYGSQERAKREIFARYASFIYLGSGRYGFAAASDYYFAKSLSSYTDADADKAALLAAIGKSPRNYTPDPGNQRLLGRRNQILDLMARNGYIPASLAKRCQAEPVRLAVRDPVKTSAPAVIEHVLGELTRRCEGRCSIKDLFEGRISVRATVDARVQTIVNEALEHGLALYEKRHPRGAGLIQGSVVVLRNADAAVLAEAGGRQIYRERDTRYSDYNRATGSLRQPGSAMKPLVYLAAFESGMTLETRVPDEPIAVPLDGQGGVKWIANYDNQFKGQIPIRQALAESRNAVAVWLTREIGVGKVIRTASTMGIRTRLRPYLSTALGASEVQLLELADAYRAIASGVLAEPHVIARVTDLAGNELLDAGRSAQAFQSPALLSIQEGLRSVVRLPDGTAHSLDARSFPVPVMGKTGTTSEYRDALFVGSTYGTGGTTVAVRIGFDDDRPLGEKETGGRAALPIFREIMLRIYQEQLVGKAPVFPREIESGIDRYLAMQLLPEEERVAPPQPGVAALRVLTLPAAWSKTVEAAPDGKNRKP